MNTAPTILETDAPGDKPLPLVVGQSATRAARLEPYPRLRNGLSDFVALSATKHHIHILTSFDVSAFAEFAAQCKTQKKRAPSIVAYAARCLGTVLIKNPELMAARLGKNLLIPSAVHLVLTMEAKTLGGDAMPILVKLGDVDSKDLKTIGTELSERARFFKRNPIGSDRLFKAATWFAGRAAHTRRAAYFLAGCLPQTRRQMANFYTHVGFTSTTQFARGHGGWGVPIYPFTISMALGGMSKRPVVVGDEILARECLDVTFSFDHAIVDGAPATRFASDMAREMESGRLLAEYFSP